MVTDVKSTPMPPSPCPGCGKMNDMASSFHRHRPKPGDFSVCFYCGAGLRFDSNMMLRRATPLDIGALPPRELTLFLKAQEAVRERNRRLN